MKRNTRSIFGKNNKKQTKTVQTIDKPNFEFFPFNNNEMNNEHIRTKNNILLKYISGDIIIINKKR